MNKFIKKIFALPIISSIIDQSKIRSFPGFQGVKIYDIISFIIKELQKDGIVMRARAAAFSFFLSIFPGIIFIFSLTPFLPIKDFKNQLLNNITGILPDEAENYLFSIINSVTEIPRGGLLSIGFLLAIYYASNGVISLMSGFSKSYEKVYKPRGFISKRLVAIFLLFLLLILLISSVLLIVTWNQLIFWMVPELGIDDHSVGFIGGIGRTLILMFLYYCVLAVIYRYGPPTVEKFPFFSAGASLAIVLSLLTSFGFRWFVDNFGTYNEIYGAIGALIVFMVWIYFNTLIVLIGYELNASIAVNKKY